MAHHPFSLDGPFYIFQSGLYLTRAQVTSTLCLLLKRLNIPTELYASHIIRIRAATTAAEAGRTSYPGVACATLNGKGR